MNRGILINRLATMDDQDRRLQDILRSIDADLISLSRKTLTQDVVNVLIFNALTPSVLRPAQITVDQHNYAPGLLHHGTTLFLDADADRTITGLNASSVLDGAIIHIVNISAFTITLLDANFGSATVNRFFGQGSADVTMKPGFAATLIYDKVASGWRAREE